MDKKSTELVTKAKKLISTDMRGKPMTKDVYFQRISEINSVATGLYDVASVGFYKIALSSTCSRMVQLLTIYKRWLCKT